LVTHLTLSNFRNFEHLDQPISAGFTILAGENAQGKTSFLEALYWLSTARLLRGQRDSEAVRHGAAGCTAQATLEAGTTVAGALEVGARKKFFLNGASLPRAADIMGRIPTVCISMFDLSIVQGDPSDRRLFLDLELSALYPAYLRHFAAYKRALEQRNALLKMAQDRSVDPYAFEGWEEQLELHGAEMRRFRQEYLTALSTLAANVHAEMASREEVLSLRYFTKDSGASFAQTRYLDIARGSTQIGPHRDDVEVLIDGSEARLFGSQGQQRTAVISLKLATMEAWKDLLGVAPLLLLDDMLSDLDPVRRAKLCAVVSSRASQAVLTCTEATAAGSDILDIAQVLTVQNGTVRRACDVLIEFLATLCFSQRLFGLLARLEF
jgi:DNA replication and repair protein RecF